MHEARLIVDSAVKAFFNTICILIVGTLILFIPVGWIMNIFDVAGVISNGLNNVEDALHVVGVIVVPLGAIMGVFF